MDIKINDLLLANNAVLRKIVAGRNGISLHECFNGLESWFEIKTMTSETGFYVEMIDTTDLNKAKELFYKKLK